MLDLVRRAGQTRLVLVPTHCGALTGSAADLTDIFVVEDPEQARSQVRSHLPEVKLPEGIVNLTSGEQNESGAGCAITRPPPHSAIRSPPRLGRSAALIARRDGVGG